MPYTRKQVRVAEAVTHGWKPKGSAKSFTSDFAKRLLEETDDGKNKSMIRKPVKKGR